MTETLRAATRASPLARWQARRIASLLEAAHDGLRVELVPVTTEGDRRLDVPISAIGGRGAFAKEVQHAVLDGRADFAVHSAKDLTAVTIEGLALAAVPERGDVRDALVGASRDALSDGATVATGSSRRRAQLAAMRPDLRFVELRGNIGARLGKIPEGGAIVVAAAALDRLGLEDRIAEHLPSDAFIPQVGQGALAVEVRADDPRVLRLVAAIEDPVVRPAVDAERAFLAELGGDCDLPVGAHATLEGGRISITGMLAGSTLVRDTIEGDDPQETGRTLARLLSDRLHA